MSAKVVSYVWEQSKHKGTELLTLLAIADSAHDDGSTVSVLMKDLEQKTRMSERHVRKVIRKLEKSLELHVLQCKGQNRANVFNVLMKGVILTGVTKDPGHPGPRSQVTPSGPYIEGEDKRISDSDLGKPKERSKNLLTTFVSPAQSETASVSASQTSLPLNGVALPSTKEKKTPQLLAEDNWIAQELSYYTQEFDVPALNDAVWWANLSNAFPTFTQQWVSMAFADLAAWLTTNPSRKPKTPRGWKQRMSYSLKRFDEKFARRQYYAQGSGQQQYRRY